MNKLSLREHQLLCLGILKDVHAFCVKNNIHYSLAYGTLIGAIRHQGFIPWDNDIDIVMPRSEYEKFIHSYESDKYRLFFHQKDKNTDCLIAYARVCDSKKTISPNQCWTKQSCGVWIDVFPLDGVPENYLEFQDYYEKLCSMHRPESRYRLRYVSIRYKEGFMHKIKLPFRKLLLANKRKGYEFESECIREISSVDANATGYCSQLAVLDNGPVEHIPLEDISSFVLRRFEDADFYVMKGYDHVLRMVYGDYMKMPSEENRIPNDSYLKFYWR